MIHGESQCGKFVCRTLSRHLMFFVFAAGLIWCLFVDETLGQSTDSFSESVNEGETVNGSAADNRSRVQDPDGQSPNRLIDESSPHLLAHAYNPVDWYPWGDEALNRAKSENKLIFLSIGFNSCHWCHVMERDSFMNEKIAELLNENFICIKVDREERPDIDIIFLASLLGYNQIYGEGRRRTGWPLTMFLTPDAKPFFGATYLPAHDGQQGFRAGLLSVARNVQRIWNDNPEQIVIGSEEITRIANQILGTRRGNVADELKAEWVDSALTLLHGQFDPVHGGFGFSAQDPQSPKFPQAPRLEFLIEQLRVREDGTLKEQAKEMLTLTLDKMMFGGVRDHVGGGFHRYSVDRYWNIPHFEKMLYDNAQLAAVYARAAIQLNRDDYRDIAQEIVEFVLSEMTSAEGGFYSSIKADSANEQGEYEEGAYYRWSAELLKSVLSEEQFERVAQVYGLSAKPNFADKDFVLFLTQSLDAITLQLRVDRSQFEQELKSIRTRLLQQRSTRESPEVDDKILAAWNGLMIRGMVEAGRTLEEPRYVEAAIAAADFVWNWMRTESGRLYRSHAKGKSSINAYIDDYVFMIDGMLALFDITSDQKWLDRCVELQQIQNDLFWDEGRGGYFFTASDHEQVFVRFRTTTDRDTAASNSMALGNLTTLYQHTSESEYRQRAMQTITSISERVREAPIHTTTALIWLDRLLESQ